MRGRWAQVEKNQTKNGSNQTKTVQINKQIGSIKLKLLLLKNERKGI